MNPILSGFFIKADPDYENINVCAACHPACQECLGHFTEEEDPTKHAPASEDGYKECCGTVCSNGYFRVHNGLDKMKCVKSCPDGHGFNYHQFNDFLRSLMNYLKIY